MNSRRGESKMNWTIIWLLFSLVCFIFGFIAGVSYGGKVVLQTIAEGMQGSTVNINLNETILVSKMNETFYPQMEKFMKENFKVNP